MAHSAESDETDSATPMVTEDTLRSPPILYDAASDDDDEASRLQALGASVRQQDDLELAVGREADRMLLQQADELDEKRLQKATQRKGKLDAHLQLLTSKLSTAPASSSTKAEVQKVQKALEELNYDIEQIMGRAENRRKEAQDKRVTDTADVAGNKKKPDESKRDFLIRTGKITPFSKFGQDNVKLSNDLADVILDAEEEDHDGFEDSEMTDPGQDGVGPTSHVNLPKPGFADDVGSESASAADIVKTRARKKRRISYADTGARRSTSSDSSDKSFVAGIESKRFTSESEEGSDASLSLTTEGVDGVRSRPARGKRSGLGAGIEGEDLAGIDDGNEKLYQTRLRRWISSRRAARYRVIEQQRQAGAASANGVEEPESTDQSELARTMQEDEWHLPHPSIPDAEFEKGFRVPGDIFKSLYGYQKTGVRWLWELHHQGVGGIVGDEMGLGKTIQVIAFLAGIHYCKKYPGPVLVVCPATLMKQWVNEFHKWWPAFRVSILHTSGSGMLDIRRESRIDDDLDLDRFALKETHGNPRIHKAAQKVVNRVVEQGHVLITTYSGLQSYSRLLLPVDWGYAVLDEGHKIRNPDTAITLFCKELRTAHRLIMTGTPIQNNLTELWSLFDFVAPFRLGSLVTFRTEFEHPIKQGGYANASNLQVETAVNCAKALKESISPLLLQRFKSDVATDLPSKSEQVLFCKLTKPQLEMYSRFLHSPEKDAIFQGKQNALYGIDILRKICNHPDLVDHAVVAKKTNYPYGDPVKSGKMQVLQTLLELWSRTGHKTLLFAQHRIMLDILEKFMRALPGIRYRRMDGTTPIKQRQDMIDEFNGDASLHIFLLTTKVGGLGVNLTSADRVVIYDPDWNPSTDQQARERAYRLGQNREVHIYRLITEGAIEEKMYHRQLFKQFLSNKVLKDPTQRQTFHLQALQDLFSLGDSSSSHDETETGQLFQGSERRLTSRPKASSHSASHEESQIAAIPALARREEATSGAHDVKPGVDATDDASHEPTAAPQNHFLDSLLSQSGVTTAFNHDELVTSKHKGTSTRDAHRHVIDDPIMVARAARQAAVEAANHLKRSAEQAGRIPIGTVTWTGHSGDAGRPSSPSPAPAVRGGPAPRGGHSTRGRGTGPSSSSVLAHLSARQSHQRHGTADTPRRSDHDGQPDHHQLATMMRDFFKTHNGRVYSKMLIDQFDRFAKGPRRTAEFRALLKEMAVLEESRVDRRRGGRAVWVLKEEFAV